MQYKLCGGTKHYTGAMKPQYDFEKPVCQQGFFHDRQNGVNNIVLGFQHWENMKDSVPAAKKVVKKLLELQETCNPYIKFLNKHLENVRKGLTKRNMQVAILGSNSTDAEGKRYSKPQPDFNQVACLISRGKELENQRTFIIPQRASKTKEGKNIVTEINTRAKCHDPLSYAILSPSEN